MEHKRYVEGLMMGTLAFVLWGLLPLYWKLVKALSPYQIFAQRVVWSFVFVVLLLGFSKRLPHFISVIKNPKNWLGIIGPSLFISINWLVFIWAINNDYVIESSLGYFINPLVLTIFGTVFYKEKLTKLQSVGIGLASIGVLIKSIYYGHVPYVALVLAVSFAIYGLLKKQSPLDSLTGLAFETLVIGIPAIAYILFSESRGMGINGNLPNYFWLLIAFSGIATATPLILYAEGTKRLPLNVVGFLQYIAPTIMLGLGIFVFHESFFTKDILPFALIWLGLGFFSYSQYQLLAGKTLVKS